MIHQTDSNNINPNSASSASENSAITNSKPTETHVLQSAIKEISNSSCILLATVQVLVVSGTGKTKTARALIDQGFEMSLISERVVNLLCLARSHSLIGIGAQKSNKTRGVTYVKLRSLIDAQAECLLFLHILSKLTSSLPSIQVRKQDWPHLEGHTPASRLQLCIFRAD